MIGDNEKKHLDASSNSYKHLVEARKILALNIPRDDADLQTIYKNAIAYIWAAENETGKIITLIGYRQAEEAEK